MFRVMFGNNSVLYCISSEKTSRHGKNQHTVANDEQVSGVAGISVSIELLLYVLAPNGGE